MIFDLIAQEGGTIATSDGGSSPLLPGYAPDLNHNRETDLVFFSEFTHSTTLIHFDTITFLFVIAIQSFLTILFLNCYTLRNDSYEF